MTIGRELRSTISRDGELTLSIEEVAIADPRDDEIVIRVEAVPLNPTDLALLLGPADLASAVQIANGRPGLGFTIAADRLAGVRGRFGRSLPIGLEGAGTVVAAGPSAKALEGRVVATMSGGMATTLRKVRATDVIVLPEGVDAAQGASIVNPLTALGLVETARREGHRGIIHTAAASNLGQMLQKICAADGVPLINVVRTPEQVELLRSIGAAYVFDSSNGDFDERLVAAISETDATIAFDAIGGGTMGSRLLEAMEIAAVAKMADYVRTGSDVYKQLYIYGALDLSPTMLNRPAFGYRWGACGWIVFSFLRDAGNEVVARLTQRMLDELTTTFASTYSRVIGLAEVLEPDIVRTYARKATGEKFLINPILG